MKQHPNRQPRRAETMKGGDDDDGDADKQFECNRIDTRPLFLQSSHQTWEKITVRKKIAARKGGLPRLG
jgi:hypothetical protein